MFDYYPPPRRHAPPHAPGAEAAKNADDGDEGDVRRADLPAGIDNVPELVDALAERLDFSPWHGRNLDALWDEIRLLENVPESRVVLTHADLPPLPSADRRAYLALLCDAVREGREPGAPHRLTVRFPRAARRRIASLLPRPAAR